MGKKFEKAFSEPVRFYPDSWHISRNKFDRDQAALEISREIGEVVNPAELRDRLVRYQFTPEDLQWEMGCDHCWMVVDEEKHGAMPTWELERT